LSHAVPIAGLLSELRLMQPGERPSGSEKVSVCTLLDHLAPINYHDSVGIAHG